MFEFLFTPKKTLVFEVETTSCQHLSTEDYGPYNRDERCTSCGWVRGELDGQWRPPVSAHPTQENGRP